jgi:hypothetical protein
MSRQTTPTIDGHAKQIAEAMIAVLDQIETHEAERKGDGSDIPIKAYTFSEFSEAVDRGDFYLSDPIGYGLRKALRKAGKLAATLHPEQLEQIAEYASTKDGRWSRWRSFIIDKNFDGLKSPTGEILWIA